MAKSKRQRKLAIAKKTRNKKEWELGQQAHPRYGMMRIQYARISGHALVIGWACRWGFGQLVVAQNYTAERNEGVHICDPGAYTFTPAPGIHMDTEAMGANFAGEVIKALFWAQERGEEIPEHVEPTYTRTGPDGKDEYGTLAEDGSFVPLAQ